MKRLFGSVLIVMLMVSPLASAKGLEGISPADIAKAVSENDARIAGELTQAVVLIAVKSTIEDEQIAPEFFFEFPFGNPRAPRDPREQRQPRERQVQGLGSGVIINGNDGWVLTNNHVVQGADEITVYVFDEDGDPTEYAGADVRTDPKTEIAVLRIDGLEGKVLPEAKLGDSDALKVGNTMLVIGAPFGQAQSVSKGIVSAKGRRGPDPRIPGFERILYRDFIQTDAAINRGNSGGPMIDMNGEVVGISTYIESTSMGSQGVGFGIPISLVKNVIKQLIEEGKVVRGYLGIQMGTPDSNVAKALGIEEMKGILINQVYPDTPADKAGLKEADIILEVDGTAVSDSVVVQRIIQDVPVGKKVNLKIYRPSEEKQMDVSVEIGEQPEDFGLLTFESGPGRASGTQKVLGMEIRDLTENDVETMRLPEGAVGVVVTDVDKDSEAYKEGMRKDDVIVEVRWQKVEGVADFVKKAKQDDKNELLIKVISQGAKTYRAIPNTLKK